MKKHFWIGVLLVLAACSNPTPDIKSPCVGAADSPCERRAVNQG